MHWRAGISVPFRTRNMPTCSRDAAPNLLSEAYALIADIRVCSFDVFDTYLLRRCTTPDGVYELAARRIEEIRGKPLPVESFVEHRIGAEARARGEASETRGSVEIGIEEIYARFPLRLFGFARSDIDSLIEAEFEAECALCFANPDMAALLGAAKKAGVRVGFISDTYWRRDQMRRLLESCQSGLTYDFLYVSSDHGTGKAADLFPRYLQREGVDSATALHIGDNMAADIKGGQRANIRTLHYPQAPERLAAEFQSETFAFRTFCRQDRQSSRLDGGLRTMRRAVTKRLPTAKSPGDYGRNYLGPVMAGFDRFAFDRIDALANDDTRKVAVAYLGRDGLLPYRIAKQRGTANAHYIEINRRVSLIASARSVDDFAKLFKSIVEVDATAAKAILKFKPARIDRIFEEFGQPVMTGAKFAAALARHVEADEVAAHGADTRDEMLAYLRRQIPQFDDITDLVLVDLGYSGTIQKTLRTAFDLAGLRTRLHGLYLLTVDDAVDDVSGDDTIAGFISDLIVTPHGKRALLRNIAVLEQMCSSPDGSVRLYRDGQVLRERDPRHPQHIALCGEIQAGAIEFIERLEAVVANHDTDPFADTFRAASWCAALLARMLLLPSPDELTLLAPIRHDVNLGTQALAPMIDAGLVRTAGVGRGLSAALNLPEPPMWLAGSLADASRLHGLIYTMFGAGILPSALLADHKAGEVGITLIAGENARQAKVSRFVGADGRIRVHIPISSTMGVSAVAISIGQIATQGRITGATLLSGANASKAFASGDPKSLPADALGFVGVTHDGGRFSAADPQNSYLVVTLPPSRQPISVLCVEFDIADPVGSPATKTAEQHAAA